MTDAAPPEPDVILRSGVDVPENVVHRSFANEVVVLNLTTGQYHGLNPTAGRMLEAVQEEATVADAVAVLSGEFAVPDAQIEHDIVVFCGDLLDRGLISLVPPAS